MAKFAARLLLLGLVFGNSSHGHTVFTTLYVDGVNQGDGVSVRMNMDPSHAVDYIMNITSDDMACGVDGQTAVDRISPARAGNTLTFEYRVWADGSHPQEPAIDPSHKGPCSVYMKRVDDPLSNNTAEGDGWFKIYDESFDNSTGEWCTIKMSNNHGHLSAVIPEDIIQGYYLVRPELLALHQAAQNPPIPIFVQSNGTARPPTVTIPQNYVNLSMPAMTFDIYATPMALPYPMYGPPIYVAGSISNEDSHTNTESVSIPANQTFGLQPSTCVAVNGNWCGLELSAYSDESGCWNASAACWNQTTRCYATQQPTGYQGCKAWEAKCDQIDDQCNAKNYTGPPDQGKMLTPSPTPLVGGEQIVKRGAALHRYRRTQTSHIGRLGNRNGG